MDDVAKALGISKKTIYLHFKDKDEIVVEVTEHALQEDKDKCEVIYNRAADPIDEIIQSTQLMREMVGNVHPTLLNDLQKYHPNAWKCYLGHQKGFIDLVLRNLNDGKAAGLYREDIDTEILARFRVNSISSAFDNDIFPSRKYKLIDVQLQLIDHFLRGILTPKGLDIYDNYQNKLHNTNTQLHEI